MREAVVLVVSYFLGTVPVGLMVGKVSRGIDIRDYGSGNVGAANVLRTLGPGPAAVVFAGDTLKGLAAVLFAGALVQGAGRPIIVVIAGLLSIVGHSASPFLGFRGGKGVATSLGVIIGMDWLVAAIAFGLWAAIVGAFRYVSVASILASLSVPLLMHYSGALFGRPVPSTYQILALAAALLILARHRSNLKRLFGGTEPKIGQKVR
jgi:glycerol-3-phosphate acyltransferase PlsY